MVFFFKKVQFKLIIVVSLWNNIYLYSESDWRHLFSTHPTASVTSSWKALNTSAPSFPDTWPLAHHKNTIQSSLLLLFLSGGSWIVSTLRFLLFLLDDFLGSIISAIDTMSHKADIYSPSARRGEGGKERARERERESERLREGAGEGEGESEGRSGWGRGRVREGAGEGEGEWEWGKEWVRERRVKEGAGEGEAEWKKEGSLTLFLEKAFLVH